MSHLRGSNSPAAVDSHIANSANDHWSANVGYTSTAGLALAAASGSNASLTTAGAGTVNVQTADGLLSLTTTGSGNISLNPTGTGLITVNSNKITGLAAGTATGDAVRYDEFNTHASSTALHWTSPGTYTSTGVIDLSAASGSNVTIDTAGAGAMTLQTADGNLALTTTGSGNVSLNPTGTGVITANGNKITSLAAGTATGDAARYDELNAHENGAGLHWTNPGTYTSTGVIDLSAASGSNVTIDTAGAGAMTLQTADGNLSLTTTGTGNVSLNPTGTGIITVNSNKITGLAAGTATGDAVRYDEFNSHATSAALHWTSPGTYTSSGVIDLSAATNSNVTIDTAGTGTVAIQTANGDLSLITTGSGNIQLNPGTGTIAANNTKITGLAAGTATGDAVRFDEFNTHATSAALHWTSPGTYTSTGVIDLSAASGSNVTIDTAGAGAMTLQTADGTLALTTTGTGNVSLNPTGTGVITANSNKITGLAAGTASGDAVRYDEFNTHASSTALHWTSPGTYTSTGVIDLSAASGSNVTIDTAGAGAMTLQTADGDLALTTTGSGNVSFNPTGTGIITANSNKITGLAAGTATGDAARYDELNAHTTGAGLHWTNPGTYTSTGVIDLSAATNSNVTIDTTGTGTMTLQTANGNLALTTTGTGGISLTSGTNVINVNSARITGLADGTGATDAVTKQQLDSVAAGINFHEGVAVATLSTELDGWMPSGSGVGKTLTDPNVGAVTIDGYALTQPSAGYDRVLVKNYYSQVSNWTVPAGNDAGWTDQDYFFLQDHTGTRHVYFTLNASGSADPAPGGSTLIGTVDITTATDTAIQVADKIRAVLDADDSFQSDAAGSATLVVTSSLSYGVLAAATAETSPLTLNSSANNRASNGIYYVSTLGTAGVASVFTRAADSDGAPANEVVGGDFTTVTQGSTLANTGWVLQGTGTQVVDTDDLIWVQFIGSTALTAGTGIDITANVVSITTLTSHTDVTITAPANDDFLVYSGGVWVNKDATELRAIRNGYVLALSGTGGTVSGNVVTAGPYTMAAADDIVRVNPSGTTVINLPSAATVPQRYTIVDSAGSASTTNIIRVTGTGGALVLGGANYDLTSPYNSITLSSDGTNWMAAA